MARHSETYSSSSAGGRGGNATVRLLEIGTASSRVVSGSGDEMGASLDELFAGGIVDGDNALSNVL